MRAGLGAGEDGTPLVWGAKRGAQIMYKIWGGVRIALIGSALCAGAYGYSLWRCSAPEGLRPVFGDYTIRCEWNRGIQKIEVFEAGTKHEPSNPITRVMLRRLAAPVAVEAMRPIHFTVATGEIDTRAYGNLFPCKMARHGWVKIISPEAKPLPKGEVRID